MLSQFYGAFAPVSFTILGLWFIVVQTRHAEWLPSPDHRRRASAVSLHFALPGLMSLLSLIDPNSKTLWRASFAASAVVGVAALAALRPNARIRTTGVMAALHWTAVVIYALIALIAIWPGSVDAVGMSLAPLRAEALLLSLLLFLGVTVAWLLMFDDATSPGTPNSM